MSTWIESTLDKIKAAYAQAGKVQPREYKPLPPWDNLGIEMREAFSHVYGQGRRDARDEELEDREGGADAKR
jgi:hypothetical protein